MKKLFLSAAAILTLGLGVQAQTETQLNNTATGEEIVMNSENQEKVPVKLEELPDGVKKALASESYAGWKAETAFLIKGDSPYYEINVKNEAGEAATLSLDETGAPVKR